MLKISTFIITFNEEKNIEKCLLSVLPISDEVIVVDSFSVDKTEAICSKYPVKFIKNTFVNFVDQKNFALQQCQNDWVLSIDADEVVSAALQENIKKIPENTPYLGFYLNRLPNFGGAWIYHSGWYPDKLIRLFNSTCTQITGDTIHEKIIIDNAKTSNLMGALYHFTYVDISHNIVKMDHFTNIMATQSFKNKKKYNIFLHLIISPFFTFFHRYFIKKGYRDGYYGLIIAINTAFYKYLKYAKLHEKNRQNKKGK